MVFVFKFYVTLIYTIEIIHYRVTNKWKMCDNLVTSRLLSLPCHLIVTRHPRSCNSKGQDCCDGRKLLFKEVDQVQRRIHID
jgi:hypothetical protein